MLFLLKYVHRMFISVTHHNEMHHFPSLLYAYRPTKADAVSLTKDNKCSEPQSQRPHRLNKAST